MYYAISRFPCRTRPKPDLGSNADQIPELRDAAGLGDACASSREYPKRESCFRLFRGDRKEVFLYGELHTDSLGRTMAEQRAGVPADENRGSSSIRSVGIFTHRRLRGGGQSHNIPTHSIKTTQGQYYYVCCRLSLPRRGNKSETRPSLVLMP